MNWKAKLKQRFIIQPCNFNQFTSIELMLQWKNYPIQRKGIEVNIPLEKLTKNDIKGFKEDLINWENHCLLNYDDLPYHQKYRLKKIKLIGVDSCFGGDILNYAEMKHIRARLTPIDKIKPLPPIVIKTVILRLL